MSELVLAGTAVAAVTYGFLLRGAWTGKQKQNPATFLLWGFLNTIAALALATRGSSTFGLPAFYAVGSFAMTYALSRRGWKPWKTKEYLAATMVGASVLLWFWSGGQMAAIASTAGVVLAAIPLLWDLWKRPECSPFREYVYLALANGMAFVAAKNWSIEEALYPGVCLLLMVPTIWLSSRQFTQPQKRRFEF